MEEHLIKAERLVELMIRLTNNLGRMSNKYQATSDLLNGLIDEDEWKAYIRSDDCLIPVTDDVTDEELACLGMMAESGRIKLSKEELPVLLGMRNTHD